MADLALTILGSDGSWPGPGGACSGFLLQSPSTSIWIDAGSGTFARLQQYISIDRVDAIVLSHEHADHCSDIDGVSVYGIYGPGFPSPLKVLAAPGVKESALPGKDLNGVFDWEVIDPALQVTVGDIELAFDRTDHGAPTFAVLASSGSRTFAYSADTGARWSFANFKKDIDLALCEAAFAPNQVGEGHLNPRQAGELAKIGAVGKLVLTHLRPGVDRTKVEAQATAAFGEAVAIASSGDVFEV